MAQPENKMSARELVLERRKAMSTKRQGGVDDEHYAASSS